MHVSLLGSFSVVTEDGERTPSGDMQRAALALLALNAGKVVSTDRLVDELWGDFAPANPLNSVQSHIAHLRRLLGPERIVTRSPGYLLDIDPDDVDALRFERMVKDARLGPAGDLADALRAALSLWHGPALTGAGDAPFVAVEASKLDELRMAALEDRIDADLAGGGHAGLVAELQTLTAENPLRERLHGQLMMALYRSGRQADALRAYDRVRKILGEELGLSPGPQLQRLEASILVQDSTLASPDPSAAPAARPTWTTLQALPVPIAYSADERCVGRHTDLARLRERWIHSQGGHQHAFFIFGEPGIGKTRLTAEFARNAVLDGAVVLFGRCDEDVLSPFQPFVEAIGDLVTRLDDPQLAALVEGAGPSLAQLVPALALRVGEAKGPAPDQPSMLWYVDALAACFTALAATAPLVLVLDDVHWADSTTIAGLRHLLRRNTGDRAFILATYRDTGLDPSHPLAALLADLRSDRSCERIALGGLTDEDVGEIIVDLLPDPEQRSQVAAQLRRETEGNPLFIGEVIRQFAEDDSVPLSDRLLTFESTSIPVGISEVIARRLLRLSDMARSLLRLASVLGLSFTIPVLRRFASDSVSDVLSVLEEAEAAGVIREEPDSEPPEYVFTHNLIRRTLYDGMSRARRQELHAAAALAILESMGRNDASLPALARHYRAAGQAVDPVAAAEALLDAAALASRGWAKAEAADLYGAALELLPPSMEAKRRFVQLQRSVSLQAAWHAQFDDDSIRAAGGRGGEDQAG